MHGEGGLSAAEKQLDECYAQTYAALGPDSESILYAYNDLGNEMMDDFSAWSRNAIRASLPPLVDCLEEAGFRLKDRDYFINKMWDIRQFEIPLGKVDGEPYSWKPSRKPGTIEQGPPVPELPYVPSKEEAEFAAAWYRCVRPTDRPSGSADDGGESRRADDRGEVRRPACRTQSPGAADREERGGTGRAAVCGVP